VVYGFHDQTDPTDHHAAFGWEMGWWHGDLSGTWLQLALLSFDRIDLPWFSLFPYLVAAMFHLFGLYTAKAAFAILSINSLFSALTCIPLYYCTRDALGERTAAMAGWGWVIYPYSIYFFRSTGPGTMR